MPGVEPTGLALAVVLRLGDAVGLARLGDGLGDGEGDSSGGLDASSSIAGWLNRADGAPLACALQPLSASRTTTPASPNRPRHPPRTCTPSRYPDPRESTPAGAGRPTVGTVGDFPAPGRANGLAGPGSATPRSGRVHRIFSERQDTGNPGVPRNVLMWILLVRIPFAPREDHCGPTVLASGRPARLSPRHAHAAARRRRADDPTAAVPVQRPEHPDHRVDRHRAAHQRPLLRVDTRRPVHRTWATRRADLDRPARAPGARRGHLPNLDTGGAVRPVRSGLRGGHRTGG